MTVQHVSALIKSASVRRAVMNAVGRMRLVKAAQAVQPSQTAQPRLMTSQEYTRARNLMNDPRYANDPRLKRLRQHIDRYEQHMRRQAGQVKGDQRLNFGSMSWQGKTPTAAQLQKDPNLKARYDAATKAQQEFNTRYNAGNPTAYIPKMRMNDRQQGYHDVSRAMGGRLRSTGAGSTANTPDALHNVTAQGMANNARGGMQVDAQTITGGRYIPGVLGPDGKPVWVDGGTVVQRVSPNMDSRSAARSAARANANSVGRWNRMSPEAKAKARNPWSSTAQPRPYGAQTAPFGVQRDTGVDFGGGTRTGSGVSIGLSR